MVLRPCSVTNPRQAQNIEDLLASVVLMPTRRQPLFRLTYGLLVANLVPLLPSYRTGA